MIDGTEKPKNPSKFEKGVAQYNKFGSKQKRQKILFALWRKYCWQPIWKGY